MKRGISFGLWVGRNAKHTNQRLASASAVCPVFPTSEPIIETKEGHVMSAAMLVHHAATRDSTERRERVVESEEGPPTSSGRAQRSGAATQDKTEEQS